MAMRRGVGAAAVGLVVFGVYRRSRLPPSEEDVSLPPQPVPAPVPSYFLAGDIGGTNTRLQLYRLEGGEDLQVKPGHLPPGTKVHGQWYPNEEFESFTSVLDKFLQDAAKTAKDPVEEPKPTIKSSDVEVACLAVAGPVSHNKVVLTNLPWSLNGEELEKLLGIKKVELINDFVAQGYGLLSLDIKNECCCLNEAPRDPTAPIVCIGPGTGLGECFLTPSADGYTCFPTEGGHAEFAPRTERDIRILMFLRHKYQSTHRISVERVVSGHGIANIYEFLAQDRPDDVDAAFHAKFLQAKDLRGKLVAENACHCKLCDDAMNVFVRSLGAEAGVAALKWLPFGGLFLSGGATPKSLPRIQDPASGFFEAYFDKGRVSPLLRDVPLYAVLVQDLGERGAHWKAVKTLKELKASTAGE